MDNKKLQFRIVFVSLIAIFVLLWIYGKQKDVRRQNELRQQAIDVERELEKDTFRTEEEVLARLEEAIQAGDSDNVYMRVPSLYSKEDLEEIAKKVDPSIGRVTDIIYTTSTTREGDGEAVPDKYAGVNFSFEPAGDQGALIK